MLARLHSADNPESVRARKYATGSHLALAAGGVEVAPTPSRLLWQRNDARLLGYEPPQAPRAEPLLLVYALMLRAFILDLVPGRSLVAYLRDAGFRVYLLDWGGPDATRRTFHDQLSDLPVAIAAVLDDAQADRLSIMGYCQGGTMAAMHTALDSSATVRNLALLAAPIDFAPRRPGLAGAWTLWSRLPWSHIALPRDDRDAVPLDRATRAVAVAGEAQLGWPGVRGVADHLRARLLSTEEGRAWLAACRWVDESAALPGPSAEQWMREEYQENALLRGRVRVDGRAVRLDEVTASVLSIAGARDYTTPSAQTATPSHFPRARHFTRLDVDAGHVGLIVGPTATTAMWAPLARWLAVRAR